MSKFKFTVGPWNVHTGADSYGPETRKAIDLETKFARFAELGSSSPGLPSLAFPRCSSMTTTPCPI